MFRWDIGTHIKTNEEVAIKLVRTARRARARFVSIGCVTSRIITAVFADVDVFLRSRAEC